MAGKIATELLEGDRIIISLAAAGGDPAGERRAFAGTFDHLGRPVDAKGNVLYGVPALELGEQAGGVEAPAFPNEEFQRLIVENGGKPSAETARLLADYNAKIEAWEKQGHAANGAVADRIRAAALAYVEKNFEVRLTAVAGQYANVDPAQVICRPSYRDGEKPVTFTVAMAPVWGN